MVIDVIPDISSYLISSFQGGHLAQVLPVHLPLDWTGDWTILAQQFNQDIMGDMQKAFNHFVKTGQVWALLIGVILGYLFKSLTSFG